MIAIEDADKWDILLHVLAPRVRFELTSPFGHRLTSYTWLQAWAFAYLPPTRLGYLGSIPAPAYDVLKPFLSKGAYLRLQHSDSWAVATSGQTGMMYHTYHRLGYSLVARYKEASACAFFTGTTRAKSDLWS